MKTFCDSEAISTILTLNCGTWANSYIQCTIIIEKFVDLECLGACEQALKFIFTGDVSGSLKHGEQIVVSNLAPGEYTTTETTSGDWIVGSITLDDDNSSYVISSDAKTGTVTFRVEPGETVKAVFRNTKPNVVVSLTSSAGGTVISPGEGDFEYCIGTTICLDAKATDPLFRFVGWRGSLFADVGPDCNVGPTSGATGDCGGNCSAAEEMGPVDACGKTGYGVIIPPCGACLPVTLTQDHHMRAIFVSRLDTLYVDDDGPSDPAPCDSNQSDPNENGTSEHPFDMIQEAIEVAKEGATVLVRDGYYRENIDFLGKRIVVTSFNAGPSKGTHDYPIIAGTAEKGGGHVVTFSMVNDPNAGLSGFVITGGYGFYGGGIVCSKSSPTIRNCLIVGNRSASLRLGGGAVFSTQSRPVFVNCTMCGNYGGPNGAGLYSMGSKVVLLDSILCSNYPLETLSDGNSVPAAAFSNIAGGYPGLGNMDVDPQFASPGYWEHPLNPGLIVHPGDYYAVWVDGDYHLKSTSPCIDAGDPIMPCLDEPEPNGNRINMGAYGGTNQATTSAVSP